MYPEGSLVVGKLPGYDWWPGMVMYQDSTTEKEKEDENDCEKDEEEEPEPGVQVWVKWFGDNQLSKVYKLSSFVQLVLVLYCCSCLSVS